MGIRRQLAAPVYDAVCHATPLSEREKEAIKAKHVVGSLAGSQGLIPLDGLHSISVPLLSPPRTPVDLQIAASVFSLFFPIISVHPSPLSSLFATTSFCNGRFERQTHTHISALTSPSPFTLSSSHDLLNFLFIMATHGPINGVKINRTCSGSFVHILARTRFSFHLLARTSCAQRSSLFWPFLTHNPRSTAVRPHIFTPPPPPSALCWSTSLLMLSSRSHRRSPKGGQGRCLRWQDRRHP